MLWRTSSVQKADSYFEYLENNLRSFDEFCQPTNKNHNHHPACGNSPVRLLQSTVRCHLVSPYSVWLSHSEWPILSIFKFRAWFISFTSPKYIFCITQVYVFASPKFMFSITLVYVFASPRYLVGNRNDVFQNGTRQNLSEFPLKWLSRFFILTTLKKQSVSLRVKHP